MEFQLIRNATVKIKYAGKTILIDPMLCNKASFAPFVPGLKRNPIIDLKMPIEEIIAGIDAVLLTHSHPDHFDETAAKHLPKHIKLFCPPADEHFIKKQGFDHVELVNHQTKWENITLTRIEGKHGSGPVLQYMGHVSGFVLQANGESTIYFVSDSILTKEVKNVIKQFAPEIIVTNSGGGIIPGFDHFPVHMDEEQTIAITALAPSSTVIAVHLEAIDFCRTTRQSLRAFEKAKGIQQNRLMIPEDGETLWF